MQGGARRTTEPVHARPGTYYEYSSTSDGSGRRMVGLPPQAVQMARPIGGRAELLCIGALLLAATVREGDAAAECAGGWECGELPAAVVPTGTFPSPARSPVQK